MSPQHYSACALVHDRRTEIIRGFLIGLLLIAICLVPDDALARGGTNMHEGLWPPRAVVPSYEPPLPSKDFGGCGLRRYRDVRTHKCHAPGGHVH